MSYLSNAQLALLTGRPLAEVETILAPTAASTQVPTIDIRAKVNLIDAQLKELGRYIGTRTFISSNDPELVALINAVQEKASQL